MSIKQMFLEMGPEARAEVRKLLDEIDAAEKASAVEVKAATKPKATKTEETTAE